MRINEDSYARYVDNLKSVCGRRKFALVKIGSVGKWRRYPLFKVVLCTSPKPRRTVCFSAGIHGEEPAGPLAILEFLKRCNTRNLGGTKVILLPVCNPHGFNRGIRRNFLGKDLNGHFCRKNPTGENKILLDALRGETVFFFHALHEDEGATQFYLYNFEHKKERVYQDIIRLAKKYFPIRRGKRIYGDPAYHGLIPNRKDGSFEDRLFRDGAQYSMCTETPEAEALAKRVALDVDIMNLVIGFTKNI